MHFDKCALLHLIFCTFEVPLNGQLELARGWGYTLRVLFDINTFDQRRHIIFIYLIIIKHSLI